jgi:hypothetical protein
MWWKLTLIALVTLVFVIAVQPVRTHAVKVEIPPTGELPPMPRHGLLNIFSAIYVTPTSLLMSAAIVAVAVYLAFRIVRG